MAHTDEARGLASLGKAPISPQIDSVLHSSAPFTSLAVPSKQLPTNDLNSSGGLQSSSQFGPTSANGLSSFASSSHTQADIHAAKFLYGTSELLHSSPSLTVPFSTSQTSTFGVTSFSSPPFEASPASLPVKISQSSSSNGSTYSLSTSSPTILKPQPRHTMESGSYVYDMSSSNRILPRGTIKSSIIEPVVVTQLAARSASTPASSSAFRATMETTGSSKLEKPPGSKKTKKKNSSSLPAPPPGSSVASVPMAQGQAQVAEFISNRWPDALYQGWMKKRNKGKESTAKKRYLVVKTNCIEYYSDPQSPNPKGTIYLEDIAVQFNETLRVVVKEKVWEFQAESERDLTRWHVVWRAVLSSLNK